MRVYELAKELGTDSKTVIQILKENESIGTVKNHMSSVDENQKGVVKLGLKVETTKLAFTESDLDETSFDEYVDDDTKPSLYDVVKEDVEVAPTGDEDGDLSFGQKAFAKAKSEDMVSAEKETKEKFAKLQQDAWTKLSDEDKEVEKQEVIVERPIGFWGWLKGLF